VRVRGLLKLDRSRRFSEGTTRCLPTRQCHADRPATANGCLLSSDAFAKGFAPVFNALGRVDRLSNTSRPRIGGRAPCRLRTWRYARRDRPRRIDNAWASSRSTLPPTTIVGTALDPRRRSYRPRQPPRRRPVPTSAGGPSRRASALNDGLVVEAAQGRGLRGRRHRLEWEAMAVVPAPLLPGSVRRGRGKGGRARRRHPI
jgi:hypothetical protein